MSQLRVLLISLLSIWSCYGTDIVGWWCSVSERAYVPSGYEGHRTKVFVRSTSPLSVEFFVDNVSYPPFGAAWDGQTPIFSFFSSLALPNSALRTALHTCSVRPNSIREILDCHYRWVQRDNRRMTYLAQPPLTAGTYTLSKANVRSCN